MVGFIAAGTTRYGYALHRCRIGPAPAGSVALGPFLVPPCQNRVSGLRVGPGGAARWLGPVGKGKQPKKPPTKSHYQSRGPGANR